MSDTAGLVADEQEPLEATIKGEVLRMYKEVPGPRGKALGVDRNPNMCLKAQGHAAASGRPWNAMKGATQNSAEAYGVKSVMMTALKD